MSGSALSILNGMSQCHLVYNGKAGSISPREVPPDSLSKNFSFLGELVGGSQENTSYVKLYYKLCAYSSDAPSEC